MSNAYTPGPWKWTRTLDGLNALESDSIAYGILVCAEDNAPQDLNDEANARLIAAAPDLLEAILALDDLRGAWAPPEETIKAAWSKARAAIAKATGVTP
jgi:hypothetical protein